MERFVAVLLILDKTFDPLVLRIQADQAPQDGWHEQIALDMALAPNEDLESLFVDDHSDIAVVVTIQDDQTRESCRRAAPFAKIRNRPRRPAPAENHGLPLDQAGELGIDTSGPELEDLAIPRALDIEHESR